METNEATISLRGHSAKEKQQLIESWKQSGKSRMDFCKERGINYHTFISWINPKKQKKLPKVKPVKVSSGFSEVKLTSPVTGNLFAQIVIEKTQVNLFHPVSADFLKRLLGA
jgi:hypothetical protein